ncbi:aspartyl/asparaginyl beta-hydroxylase domain-containing protein [Sphingomonas sp. AR_OL41]|uniref:aspartyl/asparaginyl beta-hydroxylase domain-containing protein n=1 Tax=Sphingomonas sp. AR_OL41 TaxID=3042729 RepID=UPI00247FD941|nr:aspartyl/asparaginyl beta-hydroxylase domain-containing protein [Sphingomonas sp. AR_OL41]MDH7972679.1 aspartyl/asparaginyl beta-hydroxylase domain-containing protein [Sphingomonas sp. AR_OL41]
MRVPEQSPRAIPDRVRLPFTFDAARLCTDLDRLLRHDWTEHFVRQNYHGMWDVLPLRYKHDAKHPIMMIYSDSTATKFVDGPMLGEAPYIRELLGVFRSPLRSVRLMRLTPGSLIKEHDDLDLAAELGTARIHVPITTNPQVEFLVNRSPVRMAPGEMWYLRLSDPHSVANRGTTDRVHLVIDTVVDDWLLDTLDAAARQSA